MDLAVVIGSHARHSSGTPLVLEIPAAAIAIEVANKLTIARVAKKVVRRMTSLIIDFNSSTRHRCAFTRGHVKQPKPPASVEDAVIMVKRE